MKLNTCLPNIKSAKIKIAPAAMDTTWVTTSPLSFLRNFFKPDRHTFNMEDPPLLNYFTCEVLFFNTNFTSIDIFWPSENTMNDLNQIHRWFNNQLTPSSHMPNQLKMVRTGWSGGNPARIHLCRSWCWAFIPKRLGIQVFALAPLSFQCHRLRHQTCPQILIDW